jgi:hypothetical protein
LWRRRTDGGGVDAPTPAPVADTTTRRAAISTCVVEEQRFLTQIQACPSMPKHAQTCLSGSMHISKHQFTICHGFGSPMEYECGFTPVGFFALFVLAFCPSPSMDTKRETSARSTNPFHREMAGKRGTITLCALLLKFVLFTNGKTSTFLASRLLTTMLAQRRNSARSPAESMFLSNEVAEASLVWVLWGELNYFFMCWFVFICILNSALRS